MGVTQFSGPVYGAKTSLLKFQLAGDRVNTTNLSATIHGITVPAGEDWYVTNMGLSVGSACTGYEIQVVDDSSRLRGTTAVCSSLRKGSSATNYFTSVISSAAEGEYEGYRIVSGSTVLIRERNNGSSISATNVGVAVYGYRRWVASTRAEDV